MKIFTIIILKIIFFYSTFVNAEVKIAALYAESGPVSEIAEAIAEAKRVAVETINADGIGIVGRGLISIDSIDTCLLYTSPSPRDLAVSRMPSSA